MDDSDFSKLHATKRPRVTVPVDPEVLIALRHLSVDLGVTVPVLVEQLIVRHLAKEEEAAS